MMIKAAFFKVVFLSALMAAALQANAPAGEARKSAPSGAKREYLFLAPMFSMGAGAGFSTSDFMVMGEQLTSIVEKELGIKITYDMVGSADTTQDDSMEILAGELVKRGDFSWMDYKSYKLARKLGAPIRPLVIPSINGEKTSKDCFFVKKDSGFKTLDDLKKKRLAATIETFDESLAKDLSEMGISGSPFDFFKVVHMNDQASRLYALLMDEGDAAYEFEPVIKGLSMLDTQFKKLVPIACGEPAYIDTIVVYRETVPKEDVDGFARIIINFIKYPEFKKTPVYMIAKKMKLLFARPTDEDMRAMEKHDQELLKWKKKADEWQAEYEKRFGKGKGK